MGTVAEEQARLAAVKKSEGPAIPHGEYDKRGKYIPQSGSGTWSMRGSGTLLPPLGGKPGEDDGSFTQTTQWEPTKEMPTMGGLATPDLPEMGELPEMVTPEMGELPTYQRPDWDEDEITALAQRRGAAGLRNLRTMTQEAARQGMTAENPNVQRMNLRDALKGYGEGLEAVMSGATGEARAEYGQRYAYEAQERQINYQTATQAVRDIFSADLHTASANFQAQVETIRQVYGAEVAAEMTRVAETNTHNRVIFQASMDDYFKTGVETIQRDEGAGAGASDDKRLAFRQKVWDSLYANVSRINPYYDSYMHHLGSAQLSGGRPT